MASEQLEMESEVSNLILENDEDLESKLVSLISQLLKYGFRTMYLELDSDFQSEVISLITRIISLVSSINLDLQPKPLSKLISLVTQATSLYNSLDLDSLPKPLAKLISLVSGENSESLSDFRSLVTENLELKPNPELISLIRQIFFVVVSINSKFKKIIFLCPQVQVSLRQGKFHVTRENSPEDDVKWPCFLGRFGEFRLTGGEDVTYFRCRSCKGEYHKEYEKFPPVIKHHLHPKHSLQLVELAWDSLTRECYCCDENLKKVFCYCPACDCAMNVSCVEKTPVLYRDHPKWHEHQLALFPRRAFLVCNLCGLDDSSSPIYMCPPCDFVVHLKCINLPRVIRISRHPHRIYFTPSFDLGDWSCSVCRRKIDNDYGGYSCIKAGCSYAAHSRCATQRNVWDGKDLEGVPEEPEEEIPEPFVRISDGIIRHFSHKHHHLRLDENASRDYDENKLCEACVMPIYFGNFYSCAQCKFVLHEKCAYLSRKIYHPIHPHILTLATGDGNFIDYLDDKRCSACSFLLPHGLFYECGKEECDFQLHVQCATIFEPLVHESHVHPLFLTSKPGESRSCGVCQTERSYKIETFNCIECDDFALCYDCATLPPKARYKHDEHLLTLSYGDEVSTETYWCEVCETKIDPKKRFYTCDEYCCVTLHIECLIGSDLYLKPGSSWIHFDDVVHVLPNNHHMSRPICTGCEKRCPGKVVIKSSESTYCSFSCR